jgi:hypothetical protein
VLMLAGLIGWHRAILVWGPSEACAA